MQHVNSETNAVIKNAFDLIGNEINIASIVNE